MSDPYPTGALEALSARHSAPVRMRILDALAAMSPEDRAALALWLCPEGWRIVRSTEAATVKRIVNRIRGTGFDGATRVADLIYREFGGDGDAT